MKNSKSLLAKRQRQIRLLSNEIKNTSVRSELGFIIYFSLFWVVFFSVARTEDGTGRNLPSVFFELVTSPRGGETLLTGRHFSLLVPFLSDLW